MNATQEEWRPVVGWEDLYEVSDHGRVRSLDRTTHFIDGRVRHFKGQLLTLYCSPGTTRPRVELRRGKKHRTVVVSVLVLEAFVGPRPEGLFCCHWDDDPSNNHVSNLRWDTPSANAYDKVRNGRCHHTVKTHCPKGHAFTPENTKPSPKGKRRRLCRECHRADGRARYWRDKKTKANRNSEAKV